MPVEYQVYRGNRQGRFFEGLRIDKWIPLVRRMEIVSQYFNVPESDILEVLGDVEDYLIEGPGYVFRSAETLSNLGKRAEYVFQARLCEMGISITHAGNLVLAVINEISSINYPKFSELWHEARLGYLNKLWNPIEPANDYADLIKPLKVL